MSGEDTCQRGRSLLPRPCKGINNITNIFSILHQEIANPHSCARAGIYNSQKLNNKMPKEKILTSELVSDINRVGNQSVLQWFTENQIKIGSKGNIFDTLENALQTNEISVLQIKEAIAELEENSNKKVLLYKAGSFEVLRQSKTSILKKLHKEDGITASTVNWQLGTPKEAPTFVYMFWEEDIIKIKYIEKQYEVEADFENEKFIKVPKTVCILYIIDTNDGFTQIRFDNAYTIHRHKNEEGKSTDGAYEQFYISHLQKLFSDINFTELDLNGVANYISNEEKTRFRLNKGVATVTNGAKQTYATATIKADVRDLPEYAGAAAKTIEVWRAEDLTGYWLASEAEGKLNRDLFMRISRRQSQIRVQRGCFEKELNYGIEQIRKIQGRI